MSHTKGPWAYSNCSSASSGCQGKGGIMEITVKSFRTGYYHISGEGVCDWSQPPRWPCDEATLRYYACPEASETFIACAMERAAEDRQCQADEAAENRREEKRMLLAEDRHKGDDNGTD